MVVQTPDKHPASVFEQALSVVAIRNATSSDLECAKPLPEDLVRAVRDAAEVLGLPEWWMNGAASSDFYLGLPLGFEERLLVRSYGGLRVAFAHRRDIVAWKLQAAVDQFGAQNRHLEDLRRLHPSAEEIDAARMWFTNVEGSTSAFWSNLDSLLIDLAGDVDA